MPTIPTTLIPAERVTNFTVGTHVGVIGGFARFLPGGANERLTEDMEDVSAFPYNADNTGEDDVTDIIETAKQNSIADAESKGVYLPAGTYRLDGIISLGATFSGRSLRGDGPELTIIDQRGTRCLYLGPSDSPAPPDLVPTRVTDGMTKGSTTITVEGDGEFWQGDIGVGKLLQLQIENDPTVPVMEVYNYDVWTNEAPTKQMVRVTGRTIVNPTTAIFEIFPPIHETTTGEVRVMRALNYASLVGVEGIGVSSANRPAEPKTYSNIEISSAHNSWVYDCHAQHADNYPMRFTSVLNCAIQHCRVTGSGNTGSNGAGILIGSYNSLIVDNILEETFPLIEMNNGSCGNVIAYNFGKANGMWNTNHGAHNRFNVIEGNALGQSISDGYFGSDAYLTFYRNYFHGSFGLNLMRFNRKTTVIGNILQNAVNPALVGMPFMGNPGYSVGTAQPSLGDYWQDYQMTGEITAKADADNMEVTLNSGATSVTQRMSIHWGSPPENQAFFDVTSVAGDVLQVTRWSGTFPDIGTTVSIGPGSFSGELGQYAEQDLDVGATLLQKGNWRIDEAVQESMAGGTLVDSLAYDAEPDWWPEGYAWPPYDPSSAATNSVELIPAGARFISEGGTVATPTHSPTGGAYAEPQSVTITCATDGATIHYTTDGNTPDDTDTEYSSPVSISTFPTTLKSIAYLAEEVSAVRTSVYTEEEEEPPSGARLFRLTGKPFTIGGKRILIG
jgi:hypothetical protein